MTAPTLEVIRNCLEGIVPAIVATCDSDGTPNVSLVSQVHYVDCGRVALSYQFFNKTRRNLLDTGTAAVSVFDPECMADYRLELTYQETQSEGPLFESMKAKLAGIASHSGVQGVFHLRGADIFKVTEISTASPPVLVAPGAPRNLLSATRKSWSDLAGARTLGELLDRALTCLERYYGIAHVIVLISDKSDGRLYTVASQGYDQSGIGSDIALGHGVIGVAAREGIPIRIGHMSSDYSYSAVLRDQVPEQGDTEVPFPGLTAPESQIALPIMSTGKTLGVLFAESSEPMRFRYDDEDALAIFTTRLGDLMAHGFEAGDTHERPPVRRAAGRPPMQVRYFRADNSIFLDNAYLIKGVAGAIFWKLASEHFATGRTDFSNRELRLDPALRLPAYSENLEARLLLLQRRLEERGGPIRIVKLGRGRFRLEVPVPLMLDNVDRCGDTLIAE